ncbi:MAG: hypothetical protein AAGF90_11000, partial [Pseudomonadota bacterium]
TVPPPRPAARPGGRRPAYRGGFWGSVAAGAACAASAALGLWLGYSAPSDVAAEVAAAAEEILPDEFVSGFASLDLDAGVAMGLDFPAFDRGGSAAYLFEDEGDL